MDWRRIMTAKCVSGSFKVFESGDGRRGQLVVSLACQQNVCLAVEWEKRQGKQTKFK